VPRLLCLIFFGSGAAGLAFENLWFHQTALAFGSSVWASSLVLAGFMAGLAAGSALAARLGDRSANPARLYALLELVVAASGLALVWLLPGVGAWLAPRLAPLLEAPWLIHPLRFALAFALLLLPSTAMGATLPLLVRALSAGDPHFGSVLGRLYGWNTLGAVAGSVAVALWLIGWLGIRGSALVAAGLEVAVAAGALALAPGLPRSAPAAAALRPGGVLALCRRAPLPALVAFGAGFALLALEVIWFRLLSIAVIGTEVAFALMLAVVLAGIALGGLAGAAALRRWPGAERHLASLLFAAGAALIAGYALESGEVRALGGERTSATGLTLLLSAELMFAVSLLSGCSFPLTGALLDARAGATARAAGALTTLNTLGAALGALAGGFWLLPALGTERALLAIAGLYAALGLALVWRRPRAWSALATGAALAAALALFPHGSLLRSHLKARSWGHPVDAVELLGFREGRSETLVYYEERVFGAPYAHVLVTNGHVMSSSRWAARRYMKLYVWLPEALHPRLERALLISYGVGSTAKALVESPEIERIDVVDISQDILGTSAIVHGGGAGDPLASPRVRVRVEDGRYFLATTAERYDLITAEPPPPTLAGVQNLYTEEYFARMRERLAPGGFASYWLPLHSLPESGTRAILAAFCSVFDDCSLWSGWGYDLMLLGTRGARAPVDAARFRRAFDDERRRPELVELGFEHPEQLLATFVGDAADLRRWSAGTPALVDDHPQRIQGEIPDVRLPPPFYRELVLPVAARERFAQSGWIRRMLPAPLREAALAQFRGQLLIDRIACCAPSALAEELSHALLRETDLEIPVLWAWGSDALRQQRLAQSDAAIRRQPFAQQHAAVGALARRDRAGMRAALEALRAADGPAPDAGQLRLMLYLLAELGRSDEARALAREHAALLGAGPERALRLAFYQRAFGLALLEPAGAP